MGPLTEAAQEEETMTEEATMAAPATSIDTRYSDTRTPLAWDRAVELLAAAELYWLSTVRADGRPHVTPLIGVWHDGAFHFCTGAEEQKCRNLMTSPHVAVTTGVNTWAAGTDIVLEGVAQRVTAPWRLQAVADSYRADYGPAWAFELHEEGGFHGGGAERPGLALVFRVSPRTARAFTKDPHGQTTYRF